MVTVRALAAIGMAGDRECMTELAHITISHKDSAPQSAAMTLLHCTAPPFVAVPAAM